MSIPKCKNFADYNKYPDDANPTTNAQMQEYMLNQNDLVKQIASMVWQPQTSYAAGQIIRSSAMPAGVVAVVTTAGQSGTNEPTWKTTGTVSDSGVTWTMRNIITDIDNKYAKATGVSINNNNVSINDGAFTTTLRPDVLDFGNDRKIEATYDAESAEAYLQLQTSNSTYISLRSNSETGVVKSNIALSYTPATASNSNEIATTKFVKNQGYATQTDLNNKLDKNIVGDYIISRGTSPDGTIWYRRWNSGWLEMGGYVTTSNSSPFRTLINFPVSFADDSDYFAICSQSTSGTSGELSGTRCMKNNASSMYVGSNSRSTSVCWYAFGYGANE